MSPIEEMEGESGNKNSSNFRRGIGTVGNPNMRSGLSQQSMAKS